MAALNFFNSLVFKAPVAVTSLVNLKDSRIAAVPLLKPEVNFSRRPLQKLLFSTRPRIHHSIIVQMDGLLFAVFRLRLERDVCAASLQESFCVNFGSGVSPASTFCGLFMPPTPMLNAVLIAAKHERGYGVFVGSVAEADWSLLRSPTSALAKSLLVFTFDGPDATPWQGVFVSFAYQGKVKRKKPDVSFALSVLPHEHVPQRVSTIPFCPARISSLPFFPKASDDNAKRSPPLSMAKGIPKPEQSKIWNSEVMSTLAELFPHADVALMFDEAVSRTGASLLFVGDRSKRVLAANGDLDSHMLLQIRERFVSEVLLNRMMGPFDRCPFPNDWNMHQARNTPLDTRRKDKYDPSPSVFA